jgi:DNA invertase Pin-like site-specific DNA recombinase
MHRDKIHVQHLERLAFVYLRQSSPTQVKHNLEGHERQRRMQEHVEQLGWPAAQIRLLGGDTGQSGSSQHGREDYQTLLDAVLHRTAGLVAARELSRLARDNQDWSKLVRLCRFHDVLLCDEHRVYDAADPQDRVLLGIQGAFNEFELAMITERMQQSRRQKAERGELYEGFPPGYICRKPPVQEKHPDERVQRAVERVFDDFDRQPSAFALFRHLVAEGFVLPFVRPGQDWREVCWAVPSYDVLLGMLQNPAYAGIYVRGRQKAFHELDAQGHAVSHQRRVPRAEWEVCLRNHHEAYISEARWEHNMAKIAANTHAWGDAAKRAPGKGTSLLAGLLRCHRCAHRLQVSYSRGVRYACRGGALQREAQSKRCISFTGNAIDARVCELLLEVVRPAGIAAAQRAAEQLAHDRQRQRQLLVDRAATAHEAETRAAREYKSTDETYTTVRRKLAAEWDQTLQAVYVTEQQLAEFDAAHPVAPTAAEQEQLQRLAGDLERVWFDPQADMVLKKQIVRVLIEEIVVDLDKDRDEIVFWIHWAGGHHTEHREPRRVQRRRSAVDLPRVVDTLRKVLPDESLAAALNRARIPRPQGDGWTKGRVTKYRRQQGIAAHSEREQEQEGWLTQADAATRLLISPMSMSRLVDAGVIPSEHAGHGLPSVIRRDNLTLAVVQQAVHDLRTNHNRPLPADPNQLSLFPTTNS